jgi:hypothetical protein
MDKLSIYKIGVKGGEGKTETTGFVSSYIGNKKILSIDNFNGSGDTYKQRENPIICISDGEYCIFEGTHEQLIERLKNK